MAAESMQARPGAWLGAFVALLVVQIGPYWYVTPDSASYLSIARSVAHGDVPTNLGSRQLYYAPGYALLVSPAFLLGDRPWWAVSAIQALFAASLLLGVYIWFRRHLPRAAVLLTGLVMLNASLWLWYRRPLSETAFMVALIWTANVMDRSLASGSWRRAIALAVTAGALAAMLVSIRQVGAVCIVGFVVSMAFSAWKGRLPVARAMAVTLVVAVSSLLSLVGTIVYERQQKQKDSYTDQLADSKSNLLSQVAQGARLRVCEVGTVLVPGMFKSYTRRGGSWLEPNVGLFALVFGAVAWGWWSLARRGCDLLLASWPWYLALYVVWPYDQANRFTVPMLPVLVAGLWVCLEKWLPAPRQKRLFVGLLAAHAVVALGYWLGVDLPRAQRDARLWPSVERLAERAGEQPVATKDVPESFRIMLSFELDRPVRDWTGHKGSSDENRVQGTLVIAPAGEVFANYEPTLRAGDWQLLAPAATEMETREREMGRVKGRDTR